MEVVQQLDEGDVCPLCGGLPLHVDDQPESPCVICERPLIDIQFEDDESGLALDVFDPEMDISGVYLHNDFLEGEV